MGKVVKRSGEQTQQKLWELMRGYASSNYGFELFNISWEKDGEKSKMGRFMIGYHINLII